ncbi:hypothetical protein [Winogradskyella sp.]|uniref:hypothetical protein n=1 Tax=Winogradskyella sp. TaxID=1883156 RepID=UPI003BAB106E
MKVNHLFYDSEVNFKAMSWKRIVLSIFLGLASAVLIYGFFYVLRETDRMLFLDFEERPVVMPENERQLSNVFFATISMILGNSVSISYLFSRPQHVFPRRNNKRTRILNDQAFLGFNFIHWFAKVWFLFAAFSSQFMGSKFIVNFLLPSILLILVLYFDAWKTLSLVIKKGRWKIICIHFCTLLLLTLCLSQFDVINYKSIDEMAYKARPTIDVPTSNFEEELHDIRYYNRPVFKIDFISEDQVGYFNEYNDPIELYEVLSYIDDWHDEIPLELERKSTPRLRANKNIPLKAIKALELQLFILGKTRIIYEVENNDELTKRFYNNQIKYAISPALQEAIPRKPSDPPRVFVWDSYKERVFSDTIRVHITNKILVNDSPVSLKNLVNKFEYFISPSITFEYVYTDDTTYQDYINVLSAHKSAIRELKVSNSIYDYEAMILEIHRNRFSKDEKLNAERSRLDAEFPLLITERFE